MLRNCYLWQRAPNNAVLASPQVPRAGAGSSANLGRSLPTSACSTLRNMSWVSTALSYRFVGPVCIVRVNEGSEGRKDTAAFGWGGENLVQFFLPAVPSPQRCGAEPFYSAKATGGGLWSFGGEHVHSERLPPLSAHAHLEGTPAASLRFPTVEHQLHCQTVAPPRQLWRRRSQEGLQLLTCERTWSRKRPSRRSRDEAMGADAAAE